MAKKIVLKLITPILCIGVLLVILSAAINAPSAYSDIPKLNCNCPPGFKLNDKNECIAQNLYMQYGTNNDSGVGGLKSVLPKVRDGFSPQQIDFREISFFRSYFVWRRKYFLCKLPRP